MSPRWILCGSMALVAGARPPEPARCPEPASPPVSTAPDGAISVDCEPISPSDELTRIARDALGSDPKVRAMIRADRKAA